MTEIGPAGNRSLTTYSNYVIIVISITGPSVELVFNFYALSGIGSLKRVLSQEANSLCPIYSDW